MPTQPKPTQTEKTQRYVAVTMTPELLTALKAKAGNASLSGYVRTVLAEHLGVKLAAAATPSRQKYATDAERKAAQRAQAKSRQDLIKQLLAEHKAKLAAQAS